MRNRIRFWKISFPHSSFKKSLAATEKKFAKHFAQVFPKKKGISAGVARAGVKKAKQFETQESWSLFPLETIPGALQAGTLNLDKVPHVISLIFFSDLHDRSRTDCDFWVFEKMAMSLLLLHGMVWLKYGVTKLL